MVGNNHHFLYLPQMVGLLLVICGVWIYNDIIIMPIVRHAMKRPEDSQAGSQRKISIRSLREAIRESDEKAGKQRKVSVRSLR